MTGFHFRPVPFVATLLAVLLGCSLSYWQTQRAHQKEAIEATLQQREQLPPIALVQSVVQSLDMQKMEYTRVTLTGHFDKSWPVYLDNRPMNGAAGIEVVMPFKLDQPVNPGSADRIGQSQAPRDQYVLVVRGWLPRNAENRYTIKPYQTPEGTVTIEGLLRSGVGHVYQFGTSVPLQPCTLVQNLESAEFARASHLMTLPFIVQQTSDTSDGLQRNWARASMGAERHRGYAFQWLALAATALVFFIATSFRKKDGQSKQ